MTTNLITKEARIHVAQQIVESITEPANTAYYMFVGKHTPYPGNVDTSIGTVIIDNKRTYTDTYNNMIFGKRVTNADVAQMIPRIDYGVGKVYSMYEDTATQLYTDNFYATVNAGAFFHTFKCLYNNSNGLSTSAPDFSTLSANDDIIVSADGYIWKYMYTVSDTQERKFSTTNFFPVIANAAVSAFAVPGSIDVFKIETSGFNYNNNLKGTFSGADIKVGGNDFVYSVSSNNSASSTNGFYTGCILKIVGGTGVGQYVMINDYIANSTYRTVVVNSAFATPLSMTSSFEITPSVNITTDGKQTINCVARAVVNSVGNTIYTVEVLERGANYRNATANVTANTVVGVTDKASITPVVSPKYGHGFDPYNELGANRLCFSVTFANTESNTIVSDNDYRQVGIIKDPVFANAVLTVNNQVGVLFPTETIYRVSPIRLYTTNASINTTSAQINAASGDFVSQISPNTFLYLTSGTTQQLARVSSVTNSTNIILTSNGLFACTDTAVYLANVSSFGIVANVATGQIVVSNIVGTFGVSDLLIGNTTGAKATVNAIVRSNVVKNFDTFVEMDKYIGTALSGTFVNDEIVYFNTPGGNNYATLHSTNNVSGSGPIKIYCTNIFGSINIGDTLIGNTSAAVATISEKHSAEVVFNSGQLMYIENIDPVLRSNTQSEQFKIIFEY